MIVNLQAMLINRPREAMYLCSKQKTNEQFKQYVVYFFGFNLYNIHNNTKHVYVRLTAKFPVQIS